MSCFFTYFLADGLELTEGASLGDVLNVTIDYGSQLSKNFELGIDHCFFQSGHQDFPLITNGSIDQESDCAN